MNASITLYLDAKLSCQIILALNATNLLPLRIISAISRTAKPITILDASHVNVDFTLQIAVHVQECRRDALNIIEVFALNAFLTSNSKEGHV